MCAERERARQVDQFHGDVPRFRDTDVTLDGHAGVISGLLSQAGQPVEQCALAAVRVTDDGDRRAGMLANLDLIDSNTDGGRFSQRYLLVER